METISGIYNSATTLLYFRNIAHDVIELSRTTNGWFLSNLSLLGFPQSACNPKALKIANGNIVVFYYTIEHRLVRLEKKYSDSASQRVLWSISEISTTLPPERNSFSPPNTPHGSISPANLKNQNNNDLNKSTLDLSTANFDPTNKELPQGDLVVILSSTGTEYVYFVSILGHLIEYSKALISTPLKSTPTGWVQTNLHKSCTTAVIADSSTDELSPLAEEGYDKKRIELESEMSRLKTVENLLKIESEKAERGEALVGGSSKEQIEISLSDQDTRKMKVQHQIGSILRKTTMRPNLSGNLGNLGSSTFLYYFGNDNKMYQLYWGTGYWESAENSELNTTTSTTNTNSNTQMMNTPKKGPATIIPTNDKENFDSKTPKKSPPNTQSTPSSWWNSITSFLGSMKLSWNCLNLSQQLGLSPFLLFTAPVSVVSYRAQHLFCLDYPESQLHHFYWGMDGEWHSQNISKIFRSTFDIPLSVKAGLIAFVSGSRLVVYSIDKENRLHEFSTSALSVSGVSEFQWDHVNIHAEKLSKLPDLSVLLASCSVPINGSSVPANVLFVQNPNQHVFQIKCGSFLNSNDWDFEPLALDPNSDKLDKRTLPIGQISAVSRGVVDSLKVGTSNLLSSAYTMTGTLISGVGNSLTPLKNATQRYIGQQNQEIMHVEGPTDIVDGEEFVVMEIKPDEKEDSVEKRKEKNATAPANEEHHPQRLYPDLSESFLNNEIPNNSNLLSSGDFTM